MIIYFKRKFYRKIYIQLYYIFKLKNSLNMYNIIRFINLSKCDSYFKLSFAICIFGFL